MHEPKINKKICYVILIQVRLKLYALLTNENESEKLILITKSISSIVQVNFSTPISQVDFIKLGHFRGFLNFFYASI